MLSSLEYLYLIKLSNRGLLCICKFTVISCSFALSRLEEIILPQVEDIKYLGVLFMREGMMGHEIDRRIGAAAMWSMLW